MTRATTRGIAHAAIAVCVALVAVSSVRRVHAAPPPDLSGNWTLNYASSDLPKEAGFDPDWVDTESTTGARSGGGGGGGGGGRGGRGGGGRSSGGATGNMSPLFESEEDSKKIRELAAEITHPAGTLMITQTPAAITIADPEHGTRTFTIDGKEHTLQLGAGPLGVVTKWDGAQLAIRLLIEKNRELRITLARATTARQLIVTTQFADHGKGQLIKRYYD
jgi:hypothetical protein